MNDGRIVSHQLEPIAIGSQILDQQSIGGAIWVGRIQVIRAAGFEDNRCRAGTRVGGIFEPENGSVDRVLDPLAIIVAGEKSSGVAGRIATHQEHRRRWLGREHRRKSPLQ